MNLIFAPEVFILFKKVWDPKGEAVRFISFDIPVCCYSNISILVISIFDANNSFGLWKQYTQKSWKMLLIISSKSLKNTCKWIHLKNFTKK